MQAFSMPSSPVTPTQAEMTAWALLLNVIFTSFYSTKQPQYQIVIYNFSNIITSFFFAASLPHPPNRFASLGVIHIQPCGLFLQKFETQCFVTIFVGPLQRNLRANIPKVMTNKQDITVLKGLPRACRDKVRSVSIVGLKARNH
jgi:hypothetical protein